MSEIDPLTRDPRDTVPTWVRKMAEEEGVNVDITSHDFISWFNDKNRKFAEEEGSKIET